MPALGLCRYFRRRVSRLRPVADAGDGWPRTACLGNLIVESGVGLVVWGTLVIIFDYLIGDEP